jgi:membrane protein YdbS with pleckstrin-like domain
MRAIQSSLARGFHPMKCNQCDAEVPAGAAFCSQCGTKLGAPPVTRSAHPLQAGRIPAQPQEQELWTGTYSPKAMIGWFALASILTVVGLVAGVMLPEPTIWIGVILAIVAIWAVLLASALYLRASTKYSLTSYRLFHEKGLLGRTRDRIEVIDIDDVTLTQGFFERMLNIGTIHIISSDESLRQAAAENAAKRGGTAVSVIDGRLDMPGIEDVRRVADLIDNTRRAERNRRGVFLENV